MRTTRRHVLAAPLLAGLLTLGCAGDPDTPELEVAGEPAGDGQGTIDDDGVDEPDDAGSELERSEPDDDRGARPDAWPDPIALDASGRTGAGFVVELFDLVVTGSTIEIDVRVTNEQQEDAELDARYGGNRTILEDDLGNTYTIVPPEDDERLEVPAGTVLEGTLAFAGPLDPAAASLRLAVNPGLFSGPRTGSNDTPAPLVVIEDMPLTADGAPGADDTDTDDTDDVDDVDDVAGSGSGSLAEGRDDGRSEQV